MAKCNYYADNGRESNLFDTLNYHFKEIGFDDKRAEQEALKLWLRSKGPEFKSWASQKKENDLDGNGEPMPWHVLDWADSINKSYNLETKGSSPAEARNKILKYVNANNGFVKGISYTILSNEVNKFNNTIGYKALEIGQSKYGSRDYFVKIAKTPPSKGNPNNNYYLEVEAPVDNEVVSSKDFMSLFQGIDGIESYHQYNEERFVNAIYENLDKITGEYKNYIFGEKIIINNFNNEHLAKAEIREKIIPKFNEFETQYADKFVSWLNAGARIIDAKAYIGERGKTGSPIIKESVLEDLKGHFEYNSNDHQIRFSDLLSKGTKEGIKLDPIFQGYDPIITIHKGIDEFAISIYDVTSMNLGKKGYGDGGNIFKRFFSSDQEAARMGIDLGRNEGDIRAFILGLTAMSIKKMNPNIKIKNVAVLNPNSHANKVRSKYLWMQDFGNNIKAMRSIPRIMDSLSPELLNMVHDDSLIENSEYGIYEQPYVTMLTRMYVESLDNAIANGTPHYIISRMNEALDKMSRYKNGEFSKVHLTSMFKVRMNDLQKKYTKKELLNNKEYQYISQIILEMAAKPSFEVNNSSDLTKIQKFLTPSHNITNDVAKEAVRAIKNGNNYIERQVMNFQDNKFYPKLQEYLKRIGYSSLSNRVVDKSGTVFDNLFIKKKIKDVNGVETLADTMELHWNEQAPETKALLRSGKISKEDLKFTNALLDMIEEQMILNIQHEKRFDKSFSKESAVDYYKKNWKRGMVPVIGATSSELIFKFKKSAMKEGVGQWWRRMVNVNDIYELGRNASIKEEKAGLILDSVADQFMYQMGSDFGDTDGTYGSMERMQLMGLYGDPIKGLVMMDPLKNSTNSKNIEDILNYFVAFSIRKRHMEDNVLPIVNATYSVLWNANNSSGEDMENTIDYLKTYSDHVIHGRRVQTEMSLKVPTGLAAGMKVPLTDLKIPAITNVRIDPFINTSLSIVTFNGIALSIPVGLMAGVMNTTQLYTNAFANSLAKDGLFGPNDASKALTWLGSPAKMKLMEALMHEYSVADRSERDLLFNPRRINVRKTLFNQHYAHILSWAPDYYVRGVVMTAQMMKDGSLDAYTLDSKGNLVYDESKDPRFNGPDGKIIRNKIYEQLVEQGIQDPDVKRLVRGYDFDSARTLKWISDKYITGSYDDTTYANMSRFTVGRVLDQFKKWLYDRVHNYFGSTKYADEGGQWLVKEVDGGKQAIWEKRAQEGIFITMSNYATDIRKNNFKSFKKWSEMKPHERRNMSKLAFDMAVAAMLYTLYTGLTSGGDDDEMSKMDKESRILRIFKYSAVDLIQFAPWELFDTATSIPLAKQGERIMNMFLGDFSEMDKLLPGSASVQTISELVESPEEAIEIQ